VSFVDSVVTATGLSFKRVSSFVFDNSLADLLEDISHDRGLSISKLVLLRAIEGVLGSLASAVVASTDTSGCGDGLGWLTGRISLPLAKTEVSSLKSVLKDGKSSSTTPDSGALNLLVPLFPAGDPAEPEPERVR
jgi:hypothetical protein